MDEYLVDSFAGTYRATSKEKVLFYVSLKALTDMTLTIQLAKIKIIKKRVIITIQSDSRCLVSRGGSGIEIENVFRHNSPQMLRTVTSEFCQPVKH